MVHGGDRLHAAARRRTPKATQEAKNSILAQNLTTPTSCAEEDNVNVPLSVTGPSVKVVFTIEARHPRYEIGQGNHDADFSNCPPSAGGVMTPQETVPLYDDHVSTALVGVRDPNFHHAGMRVRVGGTTVDDIHFIRLIRRIDNTDSWPEVLVLYSDGNLRLKPQAPLSGGDELLGGDPVFGSSVVVGPAPRSARPVADVQGVTYNAADGSLLVRYVGGGTAKLRLGRVDRTVTRVQVVGRYHSSPDLPFATVRSMFVAEGNCDVDDVVWTETSGATRDDAIAAFGSGRGSDFLFRRAARSRHNTSAPDLWIGHLRSRRA
jgi:hypothetical protein